MGISGVLYSGKEKSPLHGFSMFYTTFWIQGKKEGPPQLSFACGLNFFSCLSPKNRYAGGPTLEFRPVSPIPVG